MSLKNTIRSLLCGVFFISSFYWSAVLTFLISDESGSAVLSVALICALLTNVLAGFLLAADRCRDILYQWLISLPAGVITFFIYRQTDFIYYWINKISPGYGNLSAGGGFALSFYLVLFCLCFVVAILTAVSLTKKNLEKRNAKRGDTFAG